MLVSHLIVYFQDFLELRKYTYERLDGSIRAEERFAAIRSFSKQSHVKNSCVDAEDSRAFVFLISTRAGGVGLNLVAADTVIFYEQDWNPQVDKQALQRAHRIGQNSHVLSINLVTAQTIEEVIMRRAERKLLLSHNVMGDDIDLEGKEMAGPESGDLRSIILGLHMFDPHLEKSDHVNISELTEMVEKVVAFRHKIQSGSDARKFEIDQRYMLNGQGSVELRGPESITYDPGLDEASYRSWVEKFKEASPVNNDIVLEVATYGNVQFVYGDCTHPSRDSPSEHAIIFSCVDESGNWGRGGLFDALAKLSANTPHAYERAHEFGDLHLGDLHLIPIDEGCGEGGNGDDVSLWVALAVVQSYNPRRKVPRGDISIPHLETCLAKVSYSAAQNSGTTIGVLVKVKCLPISSSMESNTYLCERKQ
ncbi:hypothetical protein M9H77_33398 [Catharanthus roseus]|uniref:Uncharacterized protein n=1 Tax=Catharanthus roseus TaxID=4058 RepID=A0ACB9ZK04_CATRO|nr:hypothetical protein M9H77_33398 [Catharanthus roseus]